jgi:hypothetical protein
MGKPKHCHKRTESSSSSSSSYDEKYSNSDKKKHRHSTSSSSYSSSDEKKLNRKVNHVEHELEKKDRELEMVDREFARRIRRLEKKYCKIYKKIKWNLRREKCLMVNGCDAYGSFSNNTVQTVLPNESIVFLVNEGSLNIDFAEKEITVRRDGVYKYAFSAQFNEPTLLELFVNNVAIGASLVGSNSGANVFTMQQLLYLHNGDVITVRNVHSTSIATAIGFDTPSQNIDMTIFKIAPLPEPCCIPPPICEKIEWTSECSTSSHSNKSDHCKMDNKYDEKTKQQTPFIAKATAPVQNNNNRANVTTNRNAKVQKK